jgi:uncharacterized protein YjbJ (UPF0337 family)
MLIAKYWMRGASASLIHKPGAEGRPRQGVQTALAAQARRTGCNANRRMLLRRLTMNWNQIEGNWKQYKGKVREKWGELTDDDLDVLEGNRDMLIGRLQEIYGKSRDEAEQEVADFEKAL